MYKKLSQNVIVAVNAISFAGAAIFGGIGVFAAIANFTKGDWYLYGFGAESLGGTIAISFFLSILALVLGIIARCTIKKISNAELLKKAYGKVAVISGLLTALFVAAALSIAIYALIGVGSKAVDQKELWLNGFLSSFIAAVVTAATAFIAKKVAAGKIAILPLATTIVLCVASLSALLMIISTIVNMYGKSSSRSGRNEVDRYLDDFYDLFY